jgi:hypothetical protein
MVRLNSTFFNAPAIEFVEIYYTTADKILKMKTVTHNNNNNNNNNSKKLTIRKCTKRLPKKICNSYN